MDQMAFNGSGSRDTARVLGVSPTTVMSTLKKSVGASPSKSHLVPGGEESKTEVGIQQVKEAGLDECGPSWVTKNSRGGCGRRWLSRRARWSRMFLVGVRIRRCWN
jgi:hypothetical protein